MPTDSKPDRPRISEGLLRNLVLLTLPLLSFQSQVLEIVKTSIKDAGRVKPAENFVLLELQALMMILDRSHTLRNLIDPDFEKSLEKACKEIFPKVASASIGLIEAQETILKGIFEALQKLKQGDKASASTSFKARPRSRDE
jgi:hypothetical protein